MRGAIAPVNDPLDIPRAVADLERAHDGLTYDRVGIKIAGTPGRLISPTKKKTVIAWLSESP